MSSVFGNLSGIALPSRRWAQTVRNAFGPLAFAIDMLVIIAAAGITGVIYHVMAYGSFDGTVNSLAVGTAAASLFALPNALRGEYVLAHYFTFRNHIRRSVYVWHVAFLGLLALGFLIRVTDVYSRGATVLFYAAGFPMLILARYALVRIVVAANKVGFVTAQRVFLLGTSHDVADFLNHYQPWDLGLHILGSSVLTPRSETVFLDDREQTLRADLARAIETARLLRPDSVFVIVPWSDSATINRCVSELMALPAEIHLGPERVLDRFDNMRISKLGRIATLQLTREPLSPLEVLIKRVFDLVVAAGILVCLAPFLAWIALLIRLDSAGPVFFVQRRYGFNQRPFRIIKFRTMTTTDDGDVIVQARHNDTRVTRVGRWLRAWSIDELPQLLNVIKGDMSLVGPRPHALSHNREYEQKISLYARRHNVKPGITGWAQVNGLRGETDTDDKMLKRVEHDLHYIDNWSLWFDVKILLLTALSRRARRNAV